MPQYLCSRINMIFFVTLNTVVSKCWPDYLEHFSCTYVLSKLLPKLLPFSYTVHAMRVQAQVGGGGGAQVLTLAVLV